jgi:2-amino-4-hydroxy-6-hydroxymethyldihydropteridine diphosphokinase
METCQDAVQAIAAIPGLHDLIVSNWWQTAPLPPSEQPLFVNGMVGFSGNIAPETLLVALQSIENHFGRRRDRVNAARTIDLDIIAMGEITRPAPDPILPHPRAHLRAFVLSPLLDIAPDWVHPVLKQKATDLLKQLTDQRCYRLNQS